MLLGREGWGKIEWESNLQTPKWDKKEEEQVLKGQSRDSAAVPGGDHGEAKCEEKKEEEAWTVTDWLQTLFEGVVQNSGEKEWT